MVYYQFTSKLIIVYQVSNLKATCYYANLVSLWRGSFVIRDAQKVPSGGIRSRELDVCHCGEHNFIRFVRPYLKY
jgi:hypothetical protein